MLATQAQVQGLEVKTSPSIGTSTSTSASTSARTVTSTSTLGKIDCLSKSIMEHTFWAPLVTPNHDLCSIPEISPRAAGTCFCFVGCNVLHTTSRNNDDERRGGRTDGRTERGDDDGTDDGTDEQMTMTTSRTTGGGRTDRGRIRRRTHGKGTKPNYCF